MAALFVSSALLFIILSHRKQKQTQTRQQRSRQQGAVIIPRELLESDYAKELKIAVEIALIAGENIMKVRDTLEISNKSIVDFVTATDKENEKLIMDALMQNFPTHKFIGEEESADAGSIAKLTDSPTWIVDPIDGTTNFIHGFPFSCVSIGLVNEKIVRVGVVVCPHNNEVFLSVRGCGAFLNGRRIAVSNAQSISESLLLTEFGYQREEENLDKIFKALRAVIRKSCHSIRTLGSGVMDLCFVACGRLDGLWAGIANENWKPWDYCAGSLILEEAGGVLSQVNGEKFDIMGDSIVACCSSNLKDELVGVFQSISTK